MSKKRIAFLQQQIIDQRKWIEQCEDNGVSYVDGPCSYLGQGEDIRNADLQHLRQLEQELQQLQA